MDLVPQLGEIYWREWGDRNHSGRRSVDSWIETALKEAGGRKELPVSFLALNNRDQVLGGVALGKSESDIQCPDDWTPWVSGMIVRPELRSSGIGQLLLNALDAWVINAGIHSTWIVTGGHRADFRAVAFYQRCGWAIVDDAPPTEGSTKRRETIDIIRVVDGKAVEHWGA